MRKLPCLILLILAISIAACQKAPETLNDIAEQKGIEDAAVNSVGSDINNVDSIDNDLNADDLSDLDSGLSDIESI